VVVGFDDSAPARRALGEAARLAAAKHEILHVVYADHVIIDSDLAGFAHAEMEQGRDDEASRVAEAAAEISAETGVAYTFERSRSAPAEAILSSASALADGSGPGAGPLIVVGRSGHGARRLLGSVPTHLLAHSPFPVLAIP
jgi:nucleotide-binding universal stress UspA family protein